MAKYLFCLKAGSRIQLPPNKGATLYGGFGHALRKIAPYYYQLLFEPGNDGAQPRPFVLLPPLDLETLYPPGHEFFCELTLFGKAIRMFPVCHAALDYLGREMGLGRTQGRFTIQGIETAFPTPQRPGSCPPASEVSALAIAAACSGSADRVTLHLATRLRLKNNGRLIRQAPPFRVFFARLLGRLNTLATFYGTGRITEPRLRDRLLRDARSIRLVRDHTGWQDLPRFSGRQKQWMKFGGLQGSITYSGNLEPFLPFLALGEWTHTGGKTTFGLGKYVMDFN